MIKVKEAFPEYEKPSVAIDTVIIRTADVVEPDRKQAGYKKMQVLLVSKKSEKENKQWHLPGTIMRLGETPIDAIRRIIDEKTNAKGTHYTQLYTVADDPLRDDRGHIISIVYFSLLDNNTEINMATDSEYEAKWFWIEKPDPDGDRQLHSDISVYTDSMLYGHGKILDDTISKIRELLMYSDIGFRLVGDVFTIKELENSFVAINERQIPAFRRFISNKVEGTGVMSSGKAYRPAELFKKRW